jgi:hypothetical protein
MTAWKSMRCGRLFASGGGNAGCGPSCAVGRDKLLPSSVAITANARVVGCGIEFRGPIGLVSVSAISGRRMPRCSLSKRTAVSAKRPEKPPIWSAGILPCVNGLLVMFGKPCRFRNLFAGMIGSPSGVFLPTIYVYHLQGSHYPCFIPERYHVSAKFWMRRLHCWETRLLLRMPKI